MRDILIERLKCDLMGPYSEDEILLARPSDVYLTGILWPQETRMSGEENERLDIADAKGSEAEGSGEEEGVSYTNHIRPSSAGVSLAARATDGIPALSVAVQFATYEPIEEELKDGEKEGNRRRNRKKWKRKGYDIQVDCIELEDRGYIDLKDRGCPAGIKLHLRTAPWSGGTLATITLANQAKPEAEDGRDGVERLTLFQTRIEIRPRLGTILVARPSRRSVLDEEDFSAALLYRNVNEFATGHTCSAEWRTAAASGTADMIATTWIPATIVPAISSHGHAVFNALRTDAKYRPLSAHWLATAVEADFVNALHQLPAAYELWITDKEDEVAALPDELHWQAKKNIAECREIHARIVDGATRIASDVAMSRAFRLANLAMHEQHGWDPDRAKCGSLEWRPFQLGFILLAAASVTDREHPDRQIMDLLWFPTGGGKTEAYLALIAFLSFYRRLSSDDAPDAGAGVAAIMRYTLRLLTTQQFVRAAAVMLACEAIRRGRISQAEVSPSELGKTPFSIGLWVGGEAVPNKVEDAARALGGSLDQPTPNQLKHCPACRKQLDWRHDRQTNTIQVRCENQDCLLFDPKNHLPIWTVDDDVYRMKPTLLIGTIDKFAQIVRKKEINVLFGISAGTPPDLILQDELHLISGPLGSIAGLYEVAIDRLFSAGGAAPKIIGSTATIQRAAEQITALFNRKTAQFPPSCLDNMDSAFAVEDCSATLGRTYLGITTAGRSARFTLRSVAASLLQSAFGASSNNGERDPYWTLVTYFNSLKELGSALVLMQDSVNRSLTLLAQQRNESARRSEFIQELTSRLTQAEVRDMLDAMSRPAGDAAALDVVLATNMLSVGVDIPRLGLMLVHGQPKGIAEYIQATSRVGRGDVPGLIVAVLNNAKVRDRSHFESFNAWHETLYRDVEPTSVTPFASRARDRALHAVLVTLVRHLVPNMLDNPRLDQSAVNEAKELIEDIVQRAMVIDPQETDVKKELESILDTWEFRSPQSYWQPRKPRESLLQDAERVATRRARGGLPDDAWPTLNSMRSVEVSSRYRLTERLKVRERSDAE